MNFSQEMVKLYHTRTTLTTVIFWSINKCCLTADFGRWRGNIDKRIGDRQMRIDPNLLEQALSLDPFQNPWSSDLAQDLCRQKRYDEYAGVFQQVADQSVARAAWARLQQCYGLRQNYNQLDLAQKALNQARIVISLLQPGTVRDELEAGALRQGVVLYHVNGNYSDAAACYRRQAQMYQEIAAQTPDQQAATQLYLQAEIGLFAAVVEDLDKAIVSGQDTQEAFERLQEAGEWLDGVLDESKIGANYRMSLEAFCGTKHPILIGNTSLNMYASQLAARNPATQQDFRHWILLAQAQAALNSEDNLKAIALATQVVNENVYGDSTAVGHLFLVRLFVAQGDNTKALDELDKLAALPTPGTHSAKAAGLRLQAQINLAR